MRKWVSTNFWSPTANLSTLSSQHQQQHPPQQQLSRTTSVEENQNGQGQYNNGRPIQFSAPQTSLPTSIPQINVSGASRLSFVCLLPLSDVTSFQQFGEQQKQQLWARPPQQPPSQAAYPPQQYIYFPQNPSQMQSFRQIQPGTMPYYPQAQLFMSGARQVGPFPQLIQASPQFQHPQLHLPEGSTVNKLNTTGAQSLYSVEAPGTFNSTMVVSTNDRLSSYFIGSTGH